MVVRFSVGLDIILLGSHCSLSCVLILIRLVLMVMCVGTFELVLQGKRRL